MSERGKAVEHMDVSGEVKNREEVLVEVNVDSQNCQGHARCHSICPEIFKLDEQGFAIVPNPFVPPEHRDAVNHALVSCPEGAISVSGELSADESMLAPHQ